MTTDTSEATAPQSPVGNDLVFTATITMGNAAMLTPDDLARAIRKIADDRIPHAVIRGGLQPTRGLIRDDNGNTVGEWRLA